MTDLLTQLCYRLQVQNHILPPSHIAISSSAISQSSSSSNSGGSSGSVQWDRSVSLVMGLLSMGEVSILSLYTSD
jgi:hypothetical protein